MINCNYRPRTRTQRAIAVLADWQNPDHPLKLVAFAVISIATVLVLLAMPERAEAQVFAGAQDAVPVGFSQASSTMQIGTGVAYGDEAEDPIAQEECVGTDFRPGTPECSGYVVGYQRGYAMGVEQMEATAAAARQDRLERLESVVKMLERKLEGEEDQLIKAYLSGAIGQATAGIIAITLE